MPELQRLRADPLAQIMRSMATLPGDEWLSDSPMVTRFANEMVGLSTPDPEEAAVKAAFVQSARRIVVLADSSKLDAETLVQFASLKDLDTLITDSEPSPELGAALADAGVVVVIA